MKMKTIIDPPSGWKYGFPKELPEGVIDLPKWLADNGYPADQSEWASKYCRYWQEPEHEEQ